MNVNTSVLVGALIIYMLNACVISWSSCHGLLPFPGLTVPI